MIREEVLVVLRDQELTDEAKADRLVEMCDESVQNAVWESEMGEDL